MITTERLIIREFTVQDTDALFLILSDREVNTFLPWFPLKTREEAAEYLAEAHQKQAHSQDQFLAVCLRTDNIPIGYLHLSGGGHDFGYSLRKEFWHQGIITEAGRALIEDIRRRGIPFITATHDANNPKSGQVMKRLGMVYQYSYEELWQPKNILVTFRMYQLNFDKNAPVYRKYLEIHKEVRDEDA